MILSRGRRALGAGASLRRAFAWGLTVGLFLGGAASADIYEGATFPSPLVLGGGSITFDTDNLITIPGTVAGDLDDGVAVFRYSEVDVAAGVAVTVVGARPLAITSSGDMNWEADVDVSAGLAGGGAGGDGGAGGLTGGAGGAGGSIGAGVGIGGAAPNGGRGGLRDGNASLDGEGGGGRNSGTAGAAGLGGSAGEDGGNGGDGALGAGTSGGGSGAPGLGGTGGLGGTASATPDNSGLGGVAAGGSGNAGGTLQNTTGQAGDDAASPGVAGSPASAGANGGDATSGDPGTGGTFTTAANTLDLVGGTGGGGGGGGGRGGGGQGGGSGGGGSSGAGGGGGGAMEAISECGPAGTNGLGGNGRAGGAGGNGGAGGQGGTAAAGGIGADGASGGGAILLATRGLLQFSGTLDISAGTAGAAGGASAPIPGNAAGAFGAGGASPAAGASNNGTTGSWNFLQSIYCTGVGTAAGGAGGAGSAGGAGGAGGTGGASGASGGGGTGGEATPGMAKLHGSVILAATGTVTANGAASSNPEHNGKFTIISNMSASATTANQPVLTNGDTESAAITNDPLLLAPAPYDPGLDIPVIPQLVDGPDSSGILLGSFYNDSLVLPLLPGVDPLEVAVLPDASTVFDGWDQLVVQNNSGGITSGAQVVISGFGAVTLPDLADGEIWTTLIPAGTAVGSVTPISFVTQPTSVDVYVGDAVNLSIAATGGNGTLEYQWRQNGVDLVGEESPTLSIAVADLSDAGFYDCVVSDTGAPPAPSAISSAAEVGVFEHLQITQQPAGGIRFTNPPSNFAVFVGVTGGLRSVDYEWRLDGSPIVGAPNSPVYFIDPVTEADGGEYSVFVSDLGTDSELSAGAVLSVNPLGFKQQPISLTVLEPDSASFSIEIEGGRTLDGLVTITYQWFKVDDSKADQPIAGADSTTLVIDPTSPADAGGYYCQVTDAVGPVNSNVGNLTVLTSLGALSIVQQPQPLTVSGGSTAVFTVAVVGGSGPLTYVWKKDGAPILGAPNSPVLTIPGATIADEADYSVDVSDDSTTVNSDDAALTVTESGLPLAGPLGLAVVAGAVLAAGAMRFRRRK